MPLASEPPAAANDLSSLRASAARSDPAVRTSSPSFADKIPSIEQLVDEASVPDEDRTPARAYTSIIPARDPASVLASAAAPDEHPPLTLAMGGRTLPPDADKPGRSRLVLITALASTVLLVGLGGYVLMQRNAASTSAATAPAPAAQEPAPAVAAPPTTEPASPPPKAAEPSPSAQAANEPAAAAAPAPGPEVEVTITSTPRGAEVFVAGQRVGVAPTKLRLPSNVPAELELRSRGYAPLQRSVTPRAGLPPEAFELQPLVYELVVETEPPGAVVSANRRSAVAPAPVELGHLEGPINVTIDKPGFQRIARVLKLDDFALEDGRMRMKLTLPLVALGAPAARRRPAEPGAAPSALPEAPPEPTSTGSAPVEPPPVVQVRPEPEPDPEPAAPAPAPEPKTEPTPEPPAAN
jgi:outer membrane biosynthesis protein TonB